jgi:hypothetical protein
MFNRNFAVDEFISNISNLVSDKLSGNVTVQEIQRQKDVYENRKDVTNVLSREQEEEKERGEPFKADVGSAADYAKTMLSHGVALRLRGAYACYQAGDQLECLRHVFIALSVVAGGLGWKDAEAYLNDQNNILFKMKKEKEDTEV